tara:strand:- start:1261 stop:1728 length:468 start_codon:yes stop_codon:yes gene_type:complete
MAQSRQTTKEKSQERQKKYGTGRGGMYLINFLALGLLPTPLASQNGNYKQVIKGNTHRKSGYKIPTDLMTLANQGLLPTPTASDQNAGRRGDAPRKDHNPMTNNLKDAMNYQQQTSKCSQLNPQFVAEMMGFPKDWTTLPFLSGEKNHSKHTETP